MSSLLPLINDLLPMIISSSSVHVTRANTLRAPDATLGPGSSNEAVAVVSKSDKLCASVLTLTPHTTSAVRHHGEQDTIIYTASGTGVLLVSPSAGEVKRHEMEKGDFAFIPAWTEHQLLNETDQETVWIITRSGSQPTVVGLTDWGGDRTA
ncbi:cupin domain-containing protein [Colletotrichum sojae]|uniref:Cupin domain-containing protein n=1 Tax=Colletotrichum sojae TaxID=2175907 RepID=A0A8H6MP87_9PEZI|nr:cupin domain-containing protein [Colletotrichum sojae]